METQKTFAGVNTNVQVGQVTLHVQTESFPLNSMLITNVYLLGTCIHSVKWSYASHLDKVRFESKLQKAAELQQKSVVQRIPEIWAERNAQQLSESPTTEVQAGEISEEVRDHIDRLFLLAARAKKTNPQVAKMIFQEILAINPHHQLTIKKLSLLSIAA